MKKKLVIMMLICLLLTACAKQENLLLGKWEQYLDGGTQLKIDNKTYTIYKSSSLWTLYFDENGTVDYGDIRPGTWYISDDRLTIRSPLGTIWDEFQIIQLTKESLIIGQKALDQQTGASVLACYAFRHP